MTYHCRHCHSFLDYEVIDLGHQPPSNAYITPEKLDQPEVTYPLKVYLCTHCWLMQIPEYASFKELFSSDYAYFSSVSTSWCNHAEKFVVDAVDRLNLDSKSLVVEIASNDGYLLKHVKDRNIPCIGIEPTSAVGDAARELGINSIEKFFSSDLAEELISERGNARGGADLIIANNVLAHVPDINDFIEGISKLLKPKGSASIEFPHVLRLLKGMQFDTIYHEHYSYISLYNVKRIAEKYGLVVADVEELSTHGGSLRVWLTNKEWGECSKEVIKILEIEEKEGLRNIHTYSNFQRRSEDIKNSLLEFFINASRENKNVVGYGAAAKGNTLLNYAGVTKDLLLAVADGAKSKQGNFLPGSHIPIIKPEDINIYRPDLILALPWNLINEFIKIMPNRKFVTAIPKINYWNM